MKIQNLFAIGVVDADSENRFVENGRLTDAENFQVVTTEGASRGVGKNVLGNLKRSNYAYAGAVNYGVCANPNKNKIYHAIKATSFDYIIEFDTTTFASVIVLQSTTGTRLNFQSGERLRNMDIIIDPEGNGDLLSFSGDSNPPRIINIERAKTWGTDGFTAEEIMRIKGQPLYPITLEGTTSTENADSNNLQDRFLSFCYRWRYKDGYISAFSTWSEYFFTPGAFDLDFESFENYGMLNQDNGVNLTFNTGGREVIGVDVIFKLSGSSTPYLVDKFIKEDEGWADNDDVTIQFNNSKTYAVLPESEYLRSFDNVPHQVISSCVAGNRIFDANYVEQYDLIDKNGDKVVMDYTLELVANTVAEQDLGIDTSDVSYSYSGSPVNVENGQINIDFTDIVFVKDSVIFIQFNLKSQDAENEFIGNFFYVLEDDYTDLTDLLANSGFEAALEVQFMEFFEQNGGVVPPDDYIPPYVVEKGFIVTSLDDEMIITFPVIKYEIDPGATFVWDYWADVTTVATFRNIAASTSMKSIRSYEICMIYRDGPGRKTTALTSEFNTLFIPIENAVTQNQIKVVIPPTQLPPAWATTYKFGIKQSKGQYQQIIASLFFEEDGYRWIKLDGVNKNKVKDGDILTVKKDSNGVLSEIVKTKVLEVKNQEYDFIVNNQDENEEDILEPAGLYMKIKAENFEISYDPDEFQRYSDSSNNSGAAIYLGGLEKLVDGNYEPIPLTQGSVIRLYFKATGPTSGTFDRTYYVQNDYDGFEDWFNDVIVPNLPLETDDYDFDNFSFVRGFFFAGGFVETGSPDNNLFLKLAGDTLYSFTGRLVIRAIDGFFIFETEPESIDDGIFYETPEVFDIVDGEHEVLEPILTKTFNCICFGNGAESYQILDAYVYSSDSDVLNQNAPAQANSKALAIDFCPTAVSEDEYRQITRYADITYSGVYDSTTNINKLNEFNLSLANFKDDMEKRYGGIYHIRGRDTDLEVHQEDRVSRVFYGKDFLSNLDGSTNLQRIPEVLGQQDTFAGEYGISTYSMGFDFYGNSSCFVDPKRGVLLKNDINGLFEISSQNMRSYFKNLFRNNTINDVYTQYDTHNDVYIFNIKYTPPGGDTTFVTWLYSDKYNGFLCRHTFNPEAMIRCNNQFFSFKNGEVWESNVGPYNSFYGVQYPSLFSFVFSQGPSDRKNFKTFEVEGSLPVDAILTTDMDSGYVDKDDFVYEENVYRTYCHTSNDEIDTSMLAVQGIGEATITGLTLSFDFDIDPIIVSGNIVYNSDLEVVGTIQSRTDRTLTLNAVANIVSGDFVLVAKNQSVENQSLLGTYMKVDAQFSSTSAEEIYAIESEVSKSFT